MLALRDIKRQCGETFAAGGLLGILAATVSLERGEIPPTPGVANGLLSGLSPSTRRLTGPSAVLVSAVDGEGASALVVES